MPTSPRLEPRSVKSKVLSVGRLELVASGPVLRDASVSGHTVVCSFDQIGTGLMVGAKKWYQPTQEIPGGKLQRLVIAGADGAWHAADAVINHTVVMSSPQVAVPRKVSYACWQNPEGCNLYDKEGLPAAPFHVEEVTVRHSIGATAGDGGDISPSGTRRFLQRMTALYTIQPKPGYFIQDVMVDGRKYAKIVYYQGQGFTVGAYTEPIPCNGASILLVARPVRNGVHSGSSSLVDVFYDRLVLGVRGDSGVVCVRRNGSVDDSHTAIPDGQITILSLVVQPDGTYKTFANGTEIMENSNAKEMKALVPGAAGPFARQITLGCNAPDAWTTSHGGIGDVFLYKVALTDAERRELEAWIAKSLEEGKPSL